MEWSNYLTVDEGRNAADQAEQNVHSRPHRPSIIELFTGDLVARHHQHHPAADTSGATLALPQSILHRGKS